MGQESRFEQRWEFRRRDGHFESSIDETDSSSSREPVLKKRKVVFNQIPPINDESCDISRFQQKIKHVPGMNSRSIVERSNKMKGELSEEDDPACGEMGERPSYKRDIRKKSRSCGPEPDALKNSRIFMESILEELKVARQKMFIRMREEMRKVMDYDMTQEPTMRENSNKEELILVQHQKNFESGSDFRNHNARTVTGSLKHKRNVNSSTGYELIGSPELSSLVNPSNRIGSSTHLNLPTVLTEAACTEKGRFNDSPCNHVQTGVIENRMNRGKANPVFNSSIHGSSFTGDQKEKFRGRSHMGSQDPGYTGQNKFPLPLGSGIGYGFPISSRCGLDGAPKIQAHESVQNLSHVQDNNILGRSVNRGMGSVSSYMNTKTNGDAWTQGNLITRPHRGLVRQEFLYEE
ncbi:hypothetical protein BVC80_1787g91 [Macleaya cordata]|uniref:Uncharacterized protein n=1 Tax=Macleaya cordata TaxID=56857 RepID=A0A200QU97_MACCD|nr:hypothetical protein BVC80_1787g91 [Macleaya cordata]